MDDRRSLIKGPNSSQASLDRLGDLWQRMSKKNRAAFLRTLVNGISPNEAQFLLNLLHSKLKFDPFVELPSEVIRLVLQRVESPLSLIHIAGVCRGWQHSVLGDPLAWKKRLYAHRDEMNFVSRRWICAHNSIPEYINAMRWEAQLRRNWEVGECTWRITIAAHGMATITCLQMLEKQGILISGADNGTVGIWSLETGECRGTLMGHQGGVWALKATTDGCLVTGATDRSLIVWDLHTLERKFDLVGHSSTIRCVEIKGNYIISGSRDGTLRVWDRRSGECLHVLTGHSASVRCLALWRDRYVASGSYDNSVRIWDFVSGRLVSTCAGHDGKVYSLATSRDHIFSGGMDNKIRVWEPFTGSPLAVFSDHNSLVGLLQRRGKRLVAGSTTDGAVSIWDCDRLQRAGHIERAHLSSITSLDHNRYAIVTGAEGCIKLWPLYEIDAEEPAEPIEISDKTDCVWKIVCGDLYAVIAYQQSGMTRIDFLSFHPSPIRPIST